MTPARELQLRERVISDTLRSNAKLGMTRADIVDMKFFGVDRYVEGQKRCCKRTSNGCACLSEANGNCRPKCDDYLPEQFQDGAAQTQGSDPGRLRRAQNDDQITATVAFAPSVTVADV